MELIAKLLMIVLFHSISGELKIRTRAVEVDIRKVLLQVLTQKEYEFLKDLKLGNISKYKASYQHTLKLRILKSSSDDKSHV